MNKSSIEWTEATWNPVTGCTKVSPGCKHCYAERFAERWRGIPGHAYEQGFDLRLWPERLKQPLKIKTPKLVFVNSMSDQFHESVPAWFIRQVFEVMADASWHTFQVLTKRSERLLQLSPNLRWSQNIWMGVSVENSDYEFRIAELIQTGAHVKFVSFEPLLGPVDGLNLRGIDWVIVGGESGPGARPMNPDWARAIRDKCVKRGTPFLFKQWGGVQKRLAGRLLDGRTWDEYPRKNATSELES